jgi:hypothetical protein
MGSLHNTLRLGLVAGAIFATTLPIASFSTMVSADSGGNGGNPNAACNQNNYYSATPAANSTGNGANQSGPYNANCTGAPSQNGNGTGNANGKPDAGTVGNADNKNPGVNNGQGQMPNGSDHNAGYECDTNNGVGQGNPAHTGCNPASNLPFSPLAAAYPALGAVTFGAAWLVRRRRSA